MKTWHAIHMEYMKDMTTWNTWNTWDTYNTWITCHTWEQNLHDMHHIYIYIYNMACIDMPQVQLTLIVHLMAREHTTSERLLRNQCPFTCCKLKLKKNYPAWTCLLLVLMQMWVSEHSKPQPARANYFLKHTAKWPFELSLAELFLKSKSETRRDPYSHTKTTTAHGMHTRANMITTCLPL